MGAAPGFRPKAAPCDAHSSVLFGLYSMRHYEGVGPAQAVVARDHEYGVGVAYETAFNML